MLLPSSFQPSDNNVLCGRGRGCKMWKGNGVGSVRLVACTTGGFWEEDCVDLQPAVVGLPRLPPRRKVFGRLKRESFVVEQAAVPRLHEAR